ncbi:MAG: hypothetical protein DCF15_02175 [Phormidesmis priestleyi]|uniref:Uncharacterized protein n=1 Tax=Phormidesmis priestleyi TaxID=268141 RepID=A0A2W4XSR8_9CYAN|nr:MAG: hypothetical protein DCF15_02175 [Phormidesmis priestleyi]
MKPLVLGTLSALLAISLGPLATSAQAQVFSSQRNQNGAQNGAPNSTPVSQGRAELQTTLEKEETLYLDKSGTYRYDLVIRQDSAIGNQRLPVGTVVRGQFEPADGGLVYVANSVEIADRIYQINAVSQLFRDVKDPRETSAGAILTDAAIGAAGGYVLGEVFGRPDLLEVLGGAAAGVVIGNTTAPSVVVIGSKDPIVLTSN